MRKRLRLRPPKTNILNSVFIAIILVLTFSVPAMAKIVSSEELVENAHLYDGETITFRGEVIGDIMVRKDHAWIHLNDDPYAEQPSKLAGYNTGMAIWCKASNTERINFIGNYKNRGDIVEVTGVFNSACPKHAGDMDIHATNIKIIEPGYLIEHKFQTDKLWWALVLSFAAVALLITNKLRHPK